MDTPEDPVGYRLVETPGRLLVRRAGRPDVEVWVDGPTLRLRCQGVEHGPLGLFAFGPLATLVSHLQTRWRKPPRGGWPGYRGWLLRQTRRGLAPRLTGPWRRLLAAATPAAVDAQRAVFAATCGTAELTLTDAFYREPYLVRDVTRWRAAAVAVHQVRHLGSAAAHARLLSAEVVLQARACARQLGFELAVRGGPDVRRPAAALALLRDWLGLFSPDGRGYTSLNRTLMRLPAGVPARLLARLPAVRLPHPVADRLPLTLLLCAATGDPGRHREAVLRSDAGQVRRALALLGRHLGGRVRGITAVERLADFLGRFPERHTGGVVGLTEKAIRWHRSAVRDAAPAVAATGGGAAPTARPPIPLPAAAGVRFLATAAEVRAEGVRMGHCVADYAGRAVAGRCYLFHVERRGQAATVEVSPAGRVVQSKGVCNGRNAAADWGWQVLHAWAAPLRAAAPADPPADDEGDDIPF